MSKICLVMMTAPDEACAVSIVRTVVEEQLVACGNLIPGIRSIYRWKGEVCDDPEVMVLFKTTASTFDALKDRLVNLHPYDCPEVMAVDVSDGHAGYLEWVLSEVR